MRILEFPGNRPDPGGGAIFLELQNPHCDGSSYTTPSVFARVGANEVVRERARGMIAEKRLPPCFITFLICDFDIFISTPFPKAAALAIRFF